MIEYRKELFEMELLNIQQIEKYYGNKSSLTKAIDDISFSVAQGEFLAIMGASGSGKTTLLNCISTIDRVTAGHIYLENTDITTLKGKALNKFRREKLGFIFQDFNLLDTLTAYENISLALSIQKRSASEIDTAVKTVAQQLGITEVLQKYPYQMSAVRNREWLRLVRSSQTQSWCLRTSRQVRLIQRRRKCCWSVSIILIMSITQQSLW